MYSESVMKYRSHIANAFARKNVRHLRNYGRFALCESDFMADRHPFYLKQWRLHRGLSQQQLADRLESSKGYISDLERGVRRYNQDLLEALAYALMCEPADLLMRDPTKEDAIWSIWESVPETDRPKIIEMIKVFSGKKTGT